MSDQKFKIGDQVQNNTIELTYPGEKVTQVIPIKIIGFVGDDKATCEYYDLHQKKAFQIDLPISSLTLYIK